MSYLGKVYTLVSQENFDKFIDSLGDKIPAAVKPALVSHKGTVKLEKNGNEYTYSSSNPDGTIKTTTFKSGVEFEEDVVGNKSKSTYTVDGNVVTQVQNFEPTIIFNMKREYSGDQLVATIKSTTFDGVATRIYKVQN